MNDFLTGLFPSLFSNPQTLVTRPEVLEQMRRQMQQAPANQKPGMFFGFGPQFSNADAAPNVIDPTVINSIYKENVTDLPGVFTGDGTMPDRPGIFDALSDMSGEEAMGLANTLQGLLGPVEQPTIKPMSMPGASTGLRLPETDLMQFYKGLL